MSKKVTLYATGDLSRMFNVTREAVRCWHAAGMPSVGIVGRAFAFNDDAVKWVRKRLAGRNRRMRKGTLTPEGRADG